VASKDNIEKVLNDKNLKYVYEYCKNSVGRENRFTIMMPEEILVMINFGDEEGIVTSICKGIGRKRELILSDVLTEEQILKYING
jgi:hypothetical protein